MDPNQKMNPKIIYVTRDIERALGNIPGPNYMIVTNTSPLAVEVQKQYPEYVTLINGIENKSLSTNELLLDRKVQQIIAESGAGVLVFKNNPQIETLAKENNWRILNSPATLSEKIENKITQVEWLGELATKYLPKYSIQTLKSVDWKDEPFIIQWAHSHTGDGTILINSAKELDVIKQKFPERQARVSQFIVGPSFTVNVCVTPTHILMGNVSYQITGLAPFTDNTFSTIGNDWSITHSLLAEKDLMFFEEMVREIGEKMRKDGWKGLFGIDVIFGAEFDRIFLIEINARQPASVTFESFLQRENRIEGILGQTIFESHRRALTNTNVIEQLIPVNDGAQIIQRITKKTKTSSPETVAELTKEGYQVISYTNEDDNADLIRIQSPLGIMEMHNKFNARGEEIVATLLK